MEEECKFCAFVNGKKKASVVFKDEATLAFMDYKPIFHGHCLVIPREHFRTIMDVPDNLIPKLFKNVKMLSEAVKRAMSSEGILIIMNNTVSQSVPHLHIHIIPRNKGDGLKGFMWPRRSYENEKQTEEIQLRIKKEIDNLNKLN